jgi:hypothetical protein
MFLLVTCTFLHSASSCSKFQHRLDNSPIASSIYLYLPPSIDLDFLLADGLTFSLGDLPNEWNPEDLQISFKFIGFICCAETRIPQRAQSLAQTILTTINLSTRSLPSNKRVLLQHQVVDFIQTFSSLPGPTGADDSPLCMSSDPWPHP